ncbi:ankyrin repeat, PH and SEC7 domain containing protein secG-like [Corticium candelabrum]|uniref:ankyrin repeat, PH and SEC7 domain containing protein secG-like n=1 Tax=Corticium candelabrum TaxID=121492 RepID=UPI002E2599A7|nr:ankyrin repeat, PH and SEC7 domain containing protein secG-like [Corticium candelabrum]
MKRLWDRFKKGKRQCEVSDNVDGPLTLKSLALRCVLPTIDKIGSNGLSPLHVVCARGRADCLRLLLKWRKNANLNVPARKCVAIWKERRDVNEYTRFLAIKKWSLVTPLHLAVIARSCECVRLLLSHGAKAHVVAVAGVYQETPLHYAVQLGDVGIARILLDHKAKVNYSALSNKTLIHHAVVDGNRDCVRLLLERGADPNIHPLLPEEAYSCYGPHNRRQDFPLHVAGLNGDEEIVKLLLYYGADVNQLGAQKSTAVHRAAEGGSTAALSVLLATNASVNQFDNLGCSPLHYAVDNGHYDCSKNLLDHGADPNAEKGLRYCHPPLVSLLFSRNCTVECVELLLSKGANHRVLIHLLFPKVAEPF